MRVLSWCSKSILSGLFPRGFKGDIFEKIFNIGFHSFKNEGALYLLILFSDCVIFVTPSGKRVTTKIFSTHFFLKSQ